MINVWNRTLRTAATVYWALFGVFSVATALGHYPVGAYYVVATVMLVLATAAAIGARYHAPEGEQR